MAIRILCTEITDNGPDLLELFELSNINDKSPSLSLGSKTYECKLAA